MTKIAFIGAGNMNGAIISGLIKKGYDATQVIVSNPSAEKRLALHQKLGVLHTDNNIEASEFADTIVLGVKPHLITAVCADISKHIDISNKCFISIAAGCTVAQMQAALEKPCAIIRTMPNTPSQLGLGVTGLYSASGVSENQKQIAEELMSSVGIIKWLASEDEIDNIIEDLNGNIWLGTDAGISKYSGDAIINFTQEQGIIDKSIRSIIQDDQGYLWFAGNSDGLSRFDGVHFLNFGKPQGLPSSMFWSLEKDDEGNIWLGTYGDEPGNGLLKFDGKSFTTYSKDQGLPSDVIYFIHHDPNGALYMGTAEGISIFDGKSFTNFSDKNGLANNKVYCITKDKNGGFWFGTGDGVSRYNGQSFINYSGENGPGNTDIKSILEDEKGNLWLGSYGNGLYRFDGNSFLQFTTQDGLPDDVITQVALSEEGDIVIGTNNGIAVLKGFNDTNEKNDFDNDSQRLLMTVHSTLTNNELMQYAPVFEIYNTSTGYQIKDVNRGQHGIY